MLKKRYRLRGRTRFAEVREKGRSVAHPLAVLIALPNDLPHSRFGFSVSRRIGKAVKRNRARRLLREAVRLQLSNFAPGYDVILIARAPLREATFAAVYEAVAQLARRAGIWQSAPSPQAAAQRDTPAESLPHAEEAKDESHCSLAHQVVSNDNIQNTSP